MHLDKSTVDDGGHGGNVYAVAARYGLKAEGIYDFSSNINPLGPPPGLLAELKRHMHEACRYPLPQASLLRMALAAELNLPEEKILIGNGANELIHLLFLWLRPQKVLIPAPTFSEYERAARLSGAVVHHFPLLPAAPLPIKDLLDYLPKVDCLVFCNPNNPTGMFYSRELMEEIVAEANKNRVTVLLDESFFPLTGKPSQESLLHVQSGNLWVVVSLTKLWALPGLRLGFVVGPPEGIRRLNENGDPWRVNALAQRAGSFSLADKQYLKSSLAMIKVEREFLMQELGKIAGIKVYRGAANFLLIKGEKQCFSSADLYDKLAFRGILIRNAANFCGLDRSYFRIAVRPREENQRLLTELKHYFAFREA